MDCLPARRVKRVSWEISFFASTLTFIFSIFHHQKQAKPAPAKASVWQKKNERCLDFKRCTDFAQVSPSVVSLLLLLLLSLLQCLMLAMNFDNFTLNFIRLVSVSLRHTEPTQHDSQKHLWLNCTSQFGLARCSTRTGLAFIVDYEEESHAQSASFALTLSLSPFLALSILLVSFCFTLHWI